MFAGLAVSRAIQRATGVPIRRFVRTPRPVRTAEVAIGGAHVTVPPIVPDDAAHILASLRNANTTCVT